MRVTIAPGLPGFVVLVHDYCSSMTINNVLFLTTVPCVDSTFDVSFRLSVQLG